MIIGCLSNTPIEIIRILTKNTISFILLPLRLFRIVYLQVGREINFSIFYSSNMEKTAELIKYNMHKIDFFFIKTKNFIFSIVGLAMLFSFALIFIFGLAASRLCKTINIPPLTGMLIAGIILGPYCFNLIDPKLLVISAEIRQTALIIILLRAGLALKSKDLASVGLPALFMSFIPACAEISAMLFFAPKILGISLLDAAILGTVIAAVSPAVIVPKMLHLMETGFGTKKKIPQLVMAAASLDDIFVIVLFTICSGFAVSGNFSYTSLLRVPCSIIFGAAAGIVLGLALAAFFSAIKVRDTITMLITLSIAFILVTIETVIPTSIGFSGLIAIMVMGITVQKKDAERARRISRKLSKLWIAAEMLLFTLVGTALDLHSIPAVGFYALLLLCVVLVFRLLAVLLCLTRTPFTIGERFFCSIAYMPKATVQAAIGSIPLTLGLPCGTVVLSVAVISILFTAPLGSFLIDILHSKLLTQSEPLQMQ